MTSIMVIYMEVVVVLKMAKSEAERETGKRKKVENHSEKRNQKLWLHFT